MSDVVHFDSRKSPNAALVNVQLLARRTEVEVCVSGKANGLSQSLHSLLRLAYQGASKDHPSDDATLRRYRPWLDEFKTMTQEWLCQSTARPLSNQAQQHFSAKNL